MNPRVRSGRPVCRRCFGTHLAVACTRGRPTRRRGDPDPWTDLEWEQHPEAMRVVADNPDGMTLEQIGAVMGITRERVRQIEAQALQKLRDGLGGGVGTVAGLAVAIPDCEGCGLPFVRRHGRQRQCEVCDPKLKAA